MKSFSSTGVNEILATQILAVNSADVLSDSVARYEKKYSHRLTNVLQQRGNSAYELVLDLHSFEYVCRVKDIFVLQLYLSFC